MFLYLLTPLLVLGPALTCGAPRIMAPLFMICGLLTIIAKSLQTKSFPKPDKTLLVIFGAIIAYGIASYFWSIALPGEVISKTGQLAGIFGVSVFLWPILRDLTPAQRAKLGWFTFAGFALGSFVYFSEIFTHFAIYDTLHPGNTDVIDNKQNKIAVILGLWGVLNAGFILNGQFAGKKLLFSGFIALSVFILLNSESDSGTLVAMAAIPAALFFWLVPARAGLRIALFATIALFVTMPFLARAVVHTPVIMNHLSLGTSILDRFEIWDMTARRIEEHPLRGWGLDASRHIPGRGEHSRYYDNFVSLAHLHPHNGPLQIWFELGAPGMLLIVMVFLMLGWRLEQTGDASAMRYGAFTTSILFGVTLSIWGITQTWFMATIAVVALTAAASLPGRSHTA